MSRTRRGSRASLPEEQYDADDRIVALSDRRLQVSFVGADERIKTYNTLSWPLPELHDRLCEGFAAATGYNGRTRTERSATNLWTYLRRFVIYLSSLDSPPSRFEDLRAKHFRGYKESIEDAGQLGGDHALRVLSTVFNAMRDNPELSPDIMAYLSLRKRQGYRKGVDGLSDEVFGKVLKAARSDVVAIRERIRRGRAFVERFHHAPESMSHSERQIGNRLSILLSTGQLPSASDQPFPRGIIRQQRLELVSRVTPIGSDVVPMLILLAALSGRNSETLKELPASHERLSSQSVRLLIQKRRRRSGNWFEDVIWEVGNDSRQLHTTGGLYLLYNELFQPGRRWADPERLWVTWANPRAEQTEGFRYPWKDSLQSIFLALGAWAESHGIRENDVPLQLSFNRIRTSVLRRETRAVGGHMPSAARQNTQDVLFKNYLSGDTATKAWADEVLSDTFSEIEEEVRKNRTAALSVNGGRIPSAEDGSHSDQTAFTGCRDITNGPFGMDRLCPASVLTCFACPNSVIGEEHVPRLVRLKVELEERWNRLDRKTWWERYGSAWVALNDDILTRFTSEQIAHSQATEHTFLPLNLLEDVWVS